MRILRLKGLRFYLLALIVAALSPLVIFSGVMIVALGREQQAKLESSLVDTARALSLALDREFEASIRSLQVLATSEHLQAENLQKFYEQAEKVKKTQKSWDTISLSDESGRQVLTLRLPFGDPPRPGAPNNPGRLRVFESGRAWVSDLFIGRVTKTPLISITVPVFRDGKLKYALTAPIAPEYFLRFVSEQKLPSDWSATIIDRTATVIAQTKNFAATLGKPASPGFAAKSAAASEGAWREFSREGGGEYRGFHRSELSGWSVALAVPASIAEAGYWRSLLSLTIGSVILMLLGLGLASVIGRRISNSIRALSDSAAALGRGVALHDYPTSIEEIDMVAQAIATAAAERKRAEETLRQVQTRTASLLDSMGDLYILFGPDWRYLYVNEAAARAIGRPREQILRSTLWDLYPDIVGTQLDREYRRAMNERVSVAFDFYYPRTATWWENRFYPAPEGLTVFATDITERKRAEEELQTSREQLRALAAYLQSVREEERTRIARELHDEVGQALTGIKFSLVMALRSARNGAAPSLAAALALANELIGKVRDLSLELRPAMLDDLGLLAALRWHFERYTAQFNIQVNFQHTGLEQRRFEAETETAAYRITQEALTNVARHAGVDKIDVDISADESALRIIIEDSGVGFDPRTLSFKSTGGLSGMRERAIMLGGRLNIQSTRGAGTVLKADLPLAKTASREERSSEMNRRIAHDTNGS